MKFSKLALFSATTLQLVVLMLVTEMPVTSVAQEPSFQLPVQLVGFPVIILSVRIANFLKRLTYALDPGTYRKQAGTKRSKRKAVAGGNVDDDLDTLEVEKRLVEEFGEDVCIYERTCARYAARAQRTKSRDNIDWETILSQYKRSPDASKESYLLSVFLGDIVASPNLCHQLTKRGRGCKTNSGWEQR